MYAHFSPQLIATTTLASLALGIEAQETKLADDRGARRYCANSHRLLEPGSH